MNFCLIGTGNQEANETASAFQVSAKEADAIPELFHSYPEKSIIVDLSSESIGDSIEFYNKTKKYQAISTVGRLVYSTPFVSLMTQIKNEKGFSAYSVAAETPTDVYNFVTQLGSEYITMGSNLVFDLDRCVGAYQKAIEKSGNVASFRLTPASGIKSIKDLAVGCRGAKAAFVRPEDVHIYNEKLPLMIDLLHPHNFNAAAEIALMRVYKSKKWDGSLEFIIKDWTSNVRIDNRVIVEGFGEKRASCQRKCLHGKNCHFCDSAFGFAHTVDSLNIMLP